MKNIFWNRPLSHQVNFVGHMLSISATFAFALAVIIRMSEEPRSELSGEILSDLRQAEDLLHRRDF